VDYALLLLSILLTTAGQILQKSGMSKAHLIAGRHRWLRVLFLRDILLGMLCLALGAGLWLVVLSRQDVSLAYPLLSFGYVLVTLAAKWIFRETIPMIRWLGVCLILCGIYLITS